MVYINARQGRMEKKSRRKRNPSNSAGRPKRSAGKARYGAPPGNGEAGMKKASLFMNGRSQAVRLPKEFRFEGTHVWARKDGIRVILSPVDDRIERLIALMGSIPDFPDRDQGPPQIRPELDDLFGE